MQTTDEDEVARAIYEARFPDHGTRYGQKAWHDQPLTVREVWHKCARAAIPMIRAAVVEDDRHGFGNLVASAYAEADKAMRKFPQPNYVISKVAEEAGEVVKAAIHCAEGRETADNVVGEMRQLIAMLYRLWVEGDQVHGLSPVATAIRALSPREAGE